MERALTPLAPALCVVSRKLKYPGLPCAITGSSKRPDWTPVECCVIVPEAGQWG